MLPQLLAEVPVIALIFGWLLGAKHRSLSCTYQSPVSAPPDVVLVFAVVYPFGHYNYVIGRLEVISLMGHVAWLGGVFVCACLLSSLLITY